jgi:aspartate aminotransferase
LKELAEVLRAHPEIVIYSDEIYEYIVFDADHVSLLNVAPDLKERTVLINGFSKGFAMTGWRLGYAAGPSNVIGAMSKIQSQETSAPSTISQMAGIAAYRGPLRPVMKMKEAFKERRDYLLQELRSMEGVRCFTPEGAFYLFPDIRAYLNRTTPAGEKIETSTELCVYLLEQWGVAAVPGDAFGEPDGMRLSYASSMEDLQEAADRMRKGLAALVR